MNDGRIVITGIGVLSPNGTDRESYFAALKEGRSGIRVITHFDPRSLPCRIAGEVDFDSTRWVDAKNIRHVSYSPDRGNCSDSFTLCTYFG